ncbi:hypothetical protein NUU61_005311 [Penicillium alfredii]|uniref:P68 RBP/TagC-like beta-propeller domain-containing protein n=1 Tax=Penicillium alfredii TaxID=1506179 RepID=A0A9W9K7Q9_9EURO|nr:uncharacterized protein NUU61_005311 [Penicillium alfredii]KAJ5095955.1 hypothetical protein NUU61_005311 [Penicillium alfredii]
MVSPWKVLLKPSYLGIVLLALSFSVQLASATLSSKRFDLTQPSHEYFRSKPLAGVNVQQSFAFDNTNKRLFFSQIRNAVPDKEGDLVITQVDYSGKDVGHMYLNGFGHGASLGAEAMGAATYLWMEVDADANGYGQRLARFKFTNGATLGSNDPKLTKYTPVEGATQHTCSIDTVNERLVVRAQLKDGKHVSVYDLDKANKGDFEHPMANFKEPKLPTKSNTIQGVAAYGQYMYILTGNQYEITDNQINSEMTTVDMNTGGIVQGPLITRAGANLSYREPEGLAIYEVSPGKPRLFLGFASGKKADREANLFYKDTDALI